MSYTALYRKFRPETFSDVKGQDHIVTTLKNQLRSGRIGHAYIFCGTRGTGKTTAAKILGRAVNCENLQDGDPCGVCEMCRSIRNGSALNVIEIDAASNNGVDNIRDIREEVSYHPPKGKYKVYIIDEAHMLSAQAWNALLKTLEEPPDYVVFILATTEVQKIPATILSRCQRYDFHRIGVSVIADRLADLLQQEGIEAEEKALRYIARMGEGSLRDSLSLLDRCISFYLGETLTYEKVLDILGAVDTERFSQALRLILSGDAAGVIGLLNSLMSEGREPGQFTEDFIWYLRNLLLVKTSDHPGDIVDVSSETLALMEEECRMTDMETLMRYIRVLSETASRLRTSSQKRVMVETGLIRLCFPAMQVDQAAVLDRIRVLEREIEELRESRFAAEVKPSAFSGPVLYKKQESPRPAPVIPFASLPEELQKVLGQWDGIVARTDGILRGLLAHAHPALGSDTDSPVL